MMGMTVQSFHDQVSRLKEDYKIMSLTDALVYEGNEKTCVLTFDDGLKDSILNILPVLKDLEVPGVFFIQTNILEQKEELHVQKRHLLLSEIGADVFVKELNDRLPEELQIRSDPAFKADYVDDLLTCSLKWMLDFLDYEIIDPILSEIFEKYFGDDSTVFDRIYLSEEDISLMIDEGMEIGAHGHTHRQLGTMSFKDQENELIKAKEFLSPLIDDRPLYLSYPSGSYNPLTQRLLEKHDYTAAVTINKYSNNSDTPKFELGRYDCIDLS